MEELIRSFFTTTNKNEEKWSGCVRLQRHPYFHLNVCVLVNLNILTMNIFYLTIFARYLMLAKEILVKTLAMW